MKHTTPELIALLYQVHPRGMKRHDPSIGTTEEYGRRIELRRAALAEYGRFRDLLRRLRDAFPGGLVEDQGLDYPGTNHEESAGSFDACYAGRMLLPTLSPREGQHALHFRSSFLAPYYFIYSRRSLYIPRTQDERGGHDRQEETRYVLTPEERPFAEAISKEIEATFGGEPLPPAIGRTIVPELALLGRPFGDVTIHQCLFSIEEHAEPGM